MARIGHSWNEYVRLFRVVRNNITATSSQRDGFPFGDYFKLRLQQADTLDIQAALALWNDPSKLLVYNIFIANVRDQCYRALAEPMPKNGQRARRRTKAQMAAAPGRKRKLRGWDLFRYRNEETGRLETWYKPVAAEWPHEMTQRISMDREREAFYDFRANKRREILDYLQSLPAGLSDDEIIKLMRAFICRVA